MPFDVRIARPLTPRGHAFVEALEALCRAHGVLLAVDGEAAMELWPLAPEDRLTMCSEIIDNLDVQPEVNKA